MLTYKAAKSLFHRYADLRSAVTRRSEDYLLDRFPDRTREQISEISSDILENWHFRSVFKLFVVGYLNELYGVNGWRVSRLKASDYSVRYFVAARSR